MVHALQEIHRLLVRAGVLIDIHPLPEPTLFEVHLEKRVLLSEPYPEPSLQDSRLAEAALSEAVRRRLFVLKGASEFDLSVHSTSVSELVEYVEEADAYEQGRRKSPSERQGEIELVARFETAMRMAGPGARVVMREKARISSFTASDPAA